MLEGTRRLSLVFGVLGGAAGLLFGFIVWVDARDPGLGEGFFFLLSPLLGFLIPWYTIRVISWVIEGFVTDWGSGRAKELPGSVSMAAARLCTSCGKELLEDSVFCQQCGVNLDGELEPEASSDDECFNSRGLDGLAEMALPGDIAKAVSPAREEEVEENTEESGEGLIEDGVSTSEASPRTTFCTSCGKEIDNAWYHHCGATQKGSAPSSTQKDITPPTRSKWDVFWPKIFDRDSARVAALQGVWVSGVVASMQALWLLLLAIPRTSEWASDFLGLLAGVSTDGVWLQLILYASIALAIYRLCSRVAAVSGLVLLVYGKLAMAANLVELGVPPELALRKLFGSITLVILLAYVHSIRGTFGYHRFAAKAKE